jgi:hypothetical protein
MSKAKRNELGAHNIPLASRAKLLRSLSKQTKKSSNLKQVYNTIQFKDIEAMKELAKPLGLFMLERWNLRRYKSKPTLLQVENRRRSAKNSLWPR